MIVGHSQFEKIPMSIERQRQTITDEIENITKGIQDLKANNGARFTIKQLEKTKKNLKRISQATLLLNILVRFARGSIMFMQ